MLNKIFIWYTHSPHSGAQPRAGKMGWALNDRAMIKSQASLPKSASCLDLLHAVSSPHMCTHMHMFKYVLWDGWRMMMTHAAFSYYMRQLIVLKRWHLFSSWSLYNEEKQQKIVHIWFRNLCSGFSPLSRIALMGNEVASQRSLRIFVLLLQGVCCWRYMMSLSQLQW